MSFIRKGLSCMDEATFFERHFDLRNGDYIGAIWCTGTSSKGGLGVIPKIIVNLSCCLYKMPPPVHCNRRLVFGLLEVVDILMLIF
ncbi:uncharacterized protein [Rutidosis leptorrhynchoides]|uniref:uncharacterized protein isoform X7 n=1 Tax=Rutidosis leptorrhynchoides TaxID=125765 RepID=UPI003A996CC1